ncbi:hypothetical protein OPV22_011368 [Ensete ventricosum]|uniref:DUF547 domain-containing protein n=1 Tax=Ensete ventricosum TaxID=4639 RepID=A0AAV8RMV2_ENSVE|nr:hypothetical protein OPV22_011368 [Ensete ventricosum]
MEDDKSSYGRREGRRRKVCCYRSQLEQEVQILQKQLQDEFNLHVALANALAKTTAPLLNSIHNIPDEIQELLHSIATLEITVSNLEEELVTLHLQICTERAERHIAEAHLGSPPLTPGPPSPFSDCVPEHTFSSSISKSQLTQIPISMQKYVSSGCEDSQSITDIRSMERCPESETLRSRNASDEGTEMGASVQLSDEVELKNNFPIEDISNHPNKLSEEMVRCMRNIFLCLSGSSDILPEMSSLEGFQSSPIEHLSSSSFMSFSDSITMTSVFQSPEGIYQMNEVDNQMSSFDPCGVSYKMNWGNVGSYNLAAEVSWMSVGKAQLQYAAEALKRYRFFVEQLTEVNPACMSLNQKLAFWINVYNALMMHAYLAFGVPRNNVKLFSQMQKASYTIGGQSFSAAEIEFVILKMKPPMHRPQLAQSLALHKFKISSEHREYSVDSAEPLVVFALSCGMYSSPAVRIFTADNVQDELQSSMKDYIRASIGLSEKGKLLVPEMLHSFTKGVVEDSLLVDWICRYLSSDQITIVHYSKLQWKQRLLGVRSFSIVPFDSRFRYLFLPDKTS